MDSLDIKKSAEFLWERWSSGEKTGELPITLKPLNKGDGFQVQRQVIKESGEERVGWKIAATSQAGQRHIRVNGPLVGSLRSSRVIEEGNEIPIENNVMQVAEVEFAFKMSKSLQVKDFPYSRNEVLSAIDCLLPAIEIPDSRFEEFASVGEAQLIADNACAGWLIVGKPCTVNLVNQSLSSHKVLTYVDNSTIPVEGVGSNVLGDPLDAMSWIANELIKYELFLSKGDIVTTGTCLPPIPLTKVSSIKADFGKYGEITARFLKS